MCQCWHWWGDSLKRLGPVIQGFDKYFASMYLGQEGEKRQLYLHFRLSFLLFSACLQFLWLSSNFLRWLCFLGIATDILYYVYRGIRTFWVYVGALLRLIEESCSRLSHRVERPFPNTDVMEFLSPDFLLCWKELHSEYIEDVLWFPLVTWEVGFPFKFLPLFKKGKVTSSQCGFLL